MDSDDPRLSPLLIQRTKEREAAYAEIRRLQDEIARLRSVENTVVIYKEALAAAQKALKVVLG